VIRFCSASHRSVDVGLCYQSAHTGDAQDADNPSPIHHICDSESERMMLIIDKERRLGVWYRKRLAKSEATGFDSSRLGRIAALAVQIAGYDIVCRQGSAANLTLSYNFSRVFHSLLFHMQYSFCFFFAIDSLILIRAICLIAPGHYQPRKRVGGCIFM
jgi:hypothetical protein